MLESIEGRLSKFKATFQEFGTNLIDTSFIKTVVSDGTALLSILSKASTLISGVISALGGLNAVILEGGVLTLLSAMKNDKFSETKFGGTKLGKVFDKISTVVKAVPSTFKGLKEVISSISKGTFFEDLANDAIRLPKIFNNAAQAVAKFRTALKEGQTIAQAFSTSVSGIGKAMIGLAAITAAIAVFTAIKSKIEETKQEIKELADESIESGDKMMSSASSYSNLLESASSSVEAKNQLKDATLELASSLGIEESQLASVTNGYGALTEQLQKAMMAKIQLNRQNIKNQVSEVKSDLISAAANTGVGGYSGGEVDIKAIKSGRDELNKKITSLANAGQTESKEYKRAYKQWNELNSAIESYVGYASEYYETFAQEAYTEKMFGKTEPVTQTAVNNLQRTLIDSIKNDPAWDGSSEELFDAVNSVLTSQEWASSFTITPTVELELDEALDTTSFSNKISSALSAFTDDNGSFNIEGMKEVGNMMELQSKLSDDYTGKLTKQESAYKTLAGVAEEYGTTVEELVMYLEDLGEITEFTEGSSAKVLSTFNKLSQQMSDTTYASNAFSSAISEIEENGTISASTLSKLTALGYEYADCLEYNGRAITVNAEKVRELTKAENEETQAAMEEAELAAVDVWEEKAAQILELESRYNTLSDSEKIHLETLKSEASALSDTITQYGLLISQLDYANSGYKAWIDNKDSSSSDSGVIFDSAKEAYEALQEGLEYGKTQTAEYLAAADFLIPENIQEQGMAAAKEYLSAFSTMLTSDNDGISKFKAFFDLAVKSGVATLENGTFNIVDNIGLDEFVDKLGLTKDLVLAIIGELNEYDGVNIQFDDPTTTVQSIQNYIDAIDKLHDATLFGDASVSEAKEMLSLLSQYQEELQRVKELGVDISKTKWGNIDLDTRQELEWTTQNLEKFKTSLISWGNGEQWDSIVQHYKDTFSTIDAMSSSFEIQGKEVEIAFTPILDTDSGPMYLDKSTVTKYINALIDAATEDGKWSELELFAYDMKGFDDITYRGETVKGLLAAIGDEAIVAGEAMHYLGDTGSLNSLIESLEEISGVDFDPTSEDIDGLIEEWEDAINSVDGYAEALKELGASTLEEYGITIEAGEIKIDKDKFEEQVLEVKVEATLEEKSAIEVVKRLQEIVTAKNKLKTKQSLGIASRDDIKQIDEYNSEIERLKYELNSLPEEVKTELEINTNTADEGVASFKVIIDEYEQAVRKLNADGGFGSKIGIGLDTARTKALDLQMSLVAAAEAANIDLTFNADGTIDTTALRQKIEESISGVPADVEVTTNVNITSNANEVVGELSTITSAMQSMPKKASLDIKAKTAEAISKITTFKAVMKPLVDNGFEIPVKIKMSGIGGLEGTIRRKVATAASNAQKSSSSSSSSKSKGSSLTSWNPGVGIGAHPTVANGTISQAYSGGTAGASYTGTALVGEEGPEMYVSRDTNTWHTIGDNGAEFIRVKKGDIIFNARQTKALLERGYTLSRGRALLNGTAYSNSTIRDGSGINLYNLPTGSSSVSSSKSSSSKTTSSSSKTSSADKSDELQEKIDALKEKIDDIIRQYEHDIFLAQHNGKTASEIIQIYKNMQSEVHKTAEEYRKLGLAETSEEIQSLQQSWWNYQDEIKQLHEEEFNDYLDDAKFFINEIEHGNGGQEELISSWAEVLKKVNSELAYYYSLGYDETDDYVQSLIQEAWDAEEAISEAIQATVDNANSAVDDIQNVYSTLVDAGKEYAETGYLSVDSLQSIIELGPKYLAFLINEEGLLRLDEQAIQAVLAARTEEMAAEVALAYAKQILMASEKGEVATLEQLTVADLSATDATWQMAYATLGLAKSIGIANGMNASYYDNAFDYMKKMQSLSKTATKTISAYYEATNSETSATDRKGALEDVLDIVMDLIKYEKDQEIEALEEQTDKYKEIIDQKKESLELTKEENDYQKTLKDKVKEIAKLQAQITQLSLDDSREAQAKKKELEEELAELQDDLSETVADKQLEVTQDALDKEYEAFEETQNAKIKEIEASISSTEKLYQLAIQRIDNDWGGLYDDIIAWNYEAGTRIESDITESWNTATSALKEYGSYLEAITALTAEANESASGLTYNFGTYDESELGGTEAYTDNIRDQMKANSIGWFTANSAAEQSQYVAANEALGAQAGLVKKNGSWYTPTGTTPIYTLSQDEVASAVVAKMRENSSAWNAATDNETRNQLAAANQTLAARLASYLGTPITRDASGVWWINGQELYKKYHTGGIVGAEDVKSNEVLALLEKGELVLDEEKKSALYEIVDFATVLSERFGSAVSSIDSFASIGNFSNPFENIISKGLNDSLLGINSVGVSVEISEINAPIYVSQKLSDEDIRSHAKMIGEVSSEYIKEGFSKRGIRSTAGLF